MFSSQTIANGYARTTFMTVCPLLANLRAISEIFLYYIVPELFHIHLQLDCYRTSLLPLANEIYNSIPQTYLDALYLMHQQRTRYNHRRGAFVHSKVTKYDFIHYLKQVHQNDFEIFQKIGDLEVDDDDWLGIVYPLFD